MKKIQSHEKQLRIELSQKRFEHNLSRKKKRKLERIKKLPNKIFDRRIKKFKSILPPVDFSLISNYDEMLDYFDKCWEFLSQWYSINFDLWWIENLTFDSMWFMLSKIRDPNYNYWRSFKWKLPRNERLKNIFIKTKFLKHVKSDIDLSNITWWGMFSWSSDKKVVEDIAENIYDEVVMHTFGWDDSKCRKLYPTLIEMMLNTKNRAWAWNKRRVFHYLDENHISKICFIDHWYWIFDTLNDKWYTLDIINKTLWLESSNIKKLKALIKWEITDPKKRSKSWLEHRWEWLQLVFKFSDLHNVQNFNILSNDVRWNLSINKFENITKPFSWTFYYWEMHP